MKYKHKVADAKLVRTPKGKRLKQAIRQKFIAKLTADKQMSVDNHAMLNLLIHAWTLGGVHTNSNELSDTQAGD